MDKIKTDEEQEAEILALQELRIPPKAPISLHLKSLKDESVDTSAFRVKFNDCTVHRYEAKFMVRSDFPTPRNIAEGLKNDVSTEQRRVLLWDLFRQMFSSKPEIFGKDPIQLLYDCGVTIFAKERFTLPSDATHRIDLDPSGVNETYRTYLPRRIAELFVELKYVEELRIDSARLAKDELDSDRSSLALLEMIFNQKIVSSDLFHVFRQTCYLKERTNGSQFPQIDARIIKDGLSKGIRVCGPNPSKPEVLLQASVKAGAFYPAIPLKDYLCRLLDCRDLRNLDQAIADRRNFSRVKKDLKKLILITTHLRSNRMFICDGLDDKPIRDVFFEQEVRGDDGNVIKRKKVSVVDYFEDRYRTRLDCYKCPGIIQKTKDRDGNKTKNYYPIDALKIMPGQRLPLQKMDGKFQEQMIKVARMDPKQMKSTTETMAKAAFLSGSNPYARKFGFQMDTNTIQASAEILHPPALMYANRTAEEPGNDGRLAWRPPQNRRYLIGGEARKWMLINYYRSADERMLEDFVRRFTSNLQQRGTNIDAQPIVETASDVEKIKRYAQEQNVSFLMVVTKDKMDPIHDALKHFEISSKIVTQHIWQQTVFNIVRKSQNITLENVCMKTNEKLGGTNFTLKTSKVFARDNMRAHSNIQKILEDEWIARRLFIGIDLSHGGPSQGGAVSSLPSVVGICYNYNEQLSMNGLFFYQTAKETIISKLEKVVGQAIIDYKNRSQQKKWPTHLVIYRAGVSEGEFRQVTAMEKTGVKKAIAAISVSNPDFKNVGFTMIICQKSNTRIWPLGEPRPGLNGRISDADKNVRPGTLITKDIVSPNMEQFILISHRGIIGTARPVQYTVVADEYPNNKRMESKELHNLTYALCHLHGGVLGSVSTPAFLYHAGSVAKRGRNVLRYDIYGSAEDTSTISSGGGTRRTEEQDDQYTDELSRRLRVSLAHKYWC